MDISPLSIRKHEMIDESYTSVTWFQIYNEVSAVTAVKNGDKEIYMILPD